MLVMGLFISAFCQKTAIDLSFAATYNGQYVPLDSVYVENLTLVGNTTLYAPDFVLSLEYSLGFDDTKLSQNNFSVSQSYPNPFSEKTTVDLNLPEKEHIKITVRNMLGSVVAQIDKTLSQGKHSFTFYPGNDKNYLFTVSGCRSTKTVKLLQINNDPARVKQCSLVYNLSEDHTKRFKSQKAKNCFVFYAGNELRYIGYAKTTNEVIGSQVVADKPEISIDYSFEITEGIPCRGLPTISLEGKVYHTVSIGDQCWMKENMDAGLRLDVNVLVGNNGVLEKYCYDDDPSNCEIYGGLYHWKEMMLHSTSQGIQGICPDGWHLPTDDEWTILVDYLGGENIAGGKLKENGTAFWSLPNTGANNESGFFALPAGSRYHHGLFQTLGQYAVFWSSTENGFSDAWSRNLKSDDSKITRFVNNKANCHSVRCIKD